MSLPWCICGHALKLHNPECRVCSCPVKERVRSNEELAALNSRALHRVHLKDIQMLRKAEERAKRG